MSQVVVDSYKNYSGELVVKLQIGTKQVFLAETDAAILLADLRLILETEDADSEAAETTRG